MNLGTLQMTGGWFGTGLRHRHSSDDGTCGSKSWAWGTLQMADDGQVLRMARSTRRSDPWEYIGRRGISLSGSCRQGHSAAYNTQSHIKVVCNGYILTHILN